MGWFGKSNTEYIKNWHDTLGTLDTLPLNCANCVNCATAKNASFFTGEDDSPPPEIVIDTYIFLVIR